MAFPTVPTIDYSYTAFQQAQGKNEFPGTQLDNDLANLADGLAEVRTFIEGSFRSDGGLLPGALPTGTDLTSYGNDLADIYDQTAAARDEAVAAAADAEATVSGKADVATTLAGYGITDAAPLTHVGAGGSAHALATTSAHGFLASTDKAKLDVLDATADLDKPISTAVQAALNAKPVPFATKADLANATVPAAVQCVVLTGCAASGDGGALVLIRVAAQPTHLLRVRSTDRYLPDGTTSSANGGWWVGIADELRDVHFADLAVDDGGAAEDWCAAIDALYEAMSALGRDGVITGVRKCRGVVETRASTRLRWAPGASLQQTDFSVTGSFVTNVIITADTNEREQDRISLLDPYIDGSNYRQPELYALSAVGTTTLTLPAGASAVDEYYKGAIVMIVTGSGRSLSKTVTGYVGSTRVLSVSTAWSTAPSVGDTVAIGYNDNAIGFAWGASNVDIRGGILRGYPMDSQVPFVSGGKGINLEQGVYGASITGTKFYDLMTALFLSGKSGSMSNGSSAAATGITASDLYMENCGSALTLANLDGVNGIAQAGGENNFAVSNITFKNCGHAPYRIVSVYPQKSGVINLMGANSATVANVRGWNESGYPASYPTDYSTRCGYGLSGPVGAFVWGHARNTTLRDLDYIGAADAAVHIGRVRALGDDAPSSAKVSQCYDWNIYNMKIHGAVTRVVNTDPDFPIDANEVIGYWQIGVDSASTALLSTALSATTTLVLDLTENLTGKRVIGTAAAIISAGNTFASFPTGTTDLRGKTTSLERDVLTLTLADDIAGYVTLPTGAGGNPDCRIHVHTNSATFANGLLSTYGGTLMLTAQTGTTFEKSTGALANAAGTDGKVTFSVSSGRLYVSNRLGSSVVFRFYVDPCL